jgi:hypothetical protein
MAMLNRPSKQEVRDWIMHRHYTNDPLPDIAQIRCELGYRSTQALKAAKTLQQPDLSASSAAGTADRKK